MRNRWLAICLVCVAPSPMAAQRASVPDLITAARALVAAQQLDSAVALLRRAVDSSAGGTVGQRAQASVLLGVVCFYQGRDSLTAAAFRAALVLDTALRVGGLSQIDTSLVRVFEGERAQASADVAAQAAAQGPRYCVRRCLNGEMSPQLLDVPQFVVLDSGPDWMNTHAIVVVRLVISEDGVPEPETIRVASSTMRSLNTQVVDAVRAAHFRPARANGTPVRALVELRFDFRAEGLNGITYQIQGP